MELTKQNLKNVLEEKYKFYSRYKPSSMGTALATLREIAKSFDIELEV